jgi:hypothetical protein
MPTEDDLPLILKAAYEEATDDTAQESSDEEECGEELPRG